MAPMTPGQHSDVESLYEDMSRQIDFPPGSGVMHSHKMWHNIMMANYAEYKGWDPVFMPSINGTGAALLVTRTQQSRLTKKQGAELVEYANAYAANRGVKRTATKRQIREMEESGI